LSGSTVINPSGNLVAAGSGGVSRTAPSVVAYVLLASWLLFAHLPLLLIQFRELWFHPQYKCFPIILAGTALLAVAGFRTAPPCQPGSKWALRLLMFGAWSLLAVSALFCSPWLSVVSLLAAAGAFIFGVGGKTLFRHMFPAWAYGWLLVSPPMGLDEPLLSFLRSCTSRASSGVLDLLKVYHVLFGNVIEVNGKRLLVDEACSGIHSFFALVPVVIFYVFWTRRPLSWSVLLVIAAAGWALVANIVRVTGITLFASRWEIDLTTGWKHEVFGLLVYAVALGLLISTDRFLSFLTADVQAWPTSEENEAARHHLPRFRDTGLAWWLVVPAFGLLAVANAAILWQFIRWQSTETLSVQFPALKAELLPARHLNWTQTGFATIHRENDPEAGEYSQAWRYRWGNRDVVVSLDYPFRGWHDLSACYMSQGWELSEGKLSPIDVSRGGPNDAFFEVRIKRPIEIHGCLMFAVFDASGRVLRPGDPELVEAGGELVKRFHSRFDESWYHVSPENFPEVTAPSYQLQVCVTGDIPLSPEELEETRGFFRQLLQTIPSPKALAARQPAKTN
jgi:exosortase